MRDQNRMNTAHSSAPALTDAMIKKLLLGRRDYVHLLKRAVAAFQAQGLTAQEAQQRGQQFVECLKHEELFLDAKLSNSTLRALTERVATSLRGE